MLINQYQAAKVAGISKQAINEKSKKTPRPGYFIDVADGVRIDDDHPEWKAYVSNIKLRKRINGATEERKQERLIDAVLTVLVRELSLPEDELKRILGMIDKEAGL